MGSTSLVLMLLQIAGAAALLLWAVRLVRTGVERAFLIALRGWLRAAARRPVLATGSGAAVGALLQSATAVAMLVAGFTAAGTMTPAVGLAVLLGGDIGSALAVQVLARGGGALAPALLLAGVVLFLHSQGRTTRQLGRILVGLGLIFVALDMIRAATLPLADSPALSGVMGHLASDLLTAFLIGAVVAWALQSSVAAVLVCAAFAAQGGIPDPVAMAVVLGANLGGAVVALVFTLAAPLDARRVVIANLILRGGGAALALAAVPLLVPQAGLLGADTATRAINLHLGFNLAVALIGLPLARPLLALLALAMPAPPEPTDLGASALDPAALADPDRALACAAREVLRMGEEVRAMLRPAFRLYGAWDAPLAEAIGAKDRAIDRMHLDLKLYLSQLGRGTLAPEAADRSLQLAALAHNLAAAGDAIARGMLTQAKRLHDQRLSFSDRGAQELADFHDRVVANAEAALNVLMRPTPDAARALVAEKERVREIEKALQRAHLDRLGRKTPGSAETSAIHQETLRALKSVNTAFAMAAYPILEETGDLLASRLS